MTGKYVQPGGKMEYVATGLVHVNDLVVVGKQIGVAESAAAGAGDKITLAMEGVFEVPKVLGAVWIQGENVIWDVSAQAFDDNLATPAAGDVSNCCIAWSTGVNGTSKGLVKINVGLGTVT